MTGDVSDIVLIPIEAQQLVYTGFVHKNENPFPDARVRVRGINVDEATRCAHWHSARDVIAIKMRCCGEYYACYECHAALAGHETAVWPREEWGTRAVLCGICGGELTIREYLASGYRCPACGAEFNPGCRNHHHLYFEQ